MAAPGHRSGGISGSARHRSAVAQESSRGGPGMTQRRGPYTPLIERYYEDPKIMEVGERAELIFVRALSWCAQSKTDGVIPMRSLPLFCRGLREQASSLRRLCGAGLLEKLPDNAGYRVTNWLKYNRSQEEIAAAQDQDRRRKKGRTKIPNPAGIRTESERNPPGFREAVAVTGSNRTPSGSVRLEPARPTRRDAGGAASVAPDRGAVGSDPNDPPLDGDPKEIARRAIADGQRRNRSSSGRNAELRRSEWLPDRTPRPDPFAALNAAIAELTGDGDVE